MLGTYEALRLSRLRAPHTTAIDADDRTYTYAELSELVNRLANALTGLGAEKGDRVGFLMGNSAEFLACYYALERNGLVAVPMNMRLTGPEIAHVLNHSEARFLVLEDTYLPEVDRVLDQLELPAERCIVLGERGNGKMQSFGELVGWASTDEVRIPQEGTDLEALFYTSGTTGFPKGVMRTRAAEDWVRWSNGSEFGFSSEDVNYCIGPLFHQSYLLLAQCHLSLGGTVVIERAWDPERALTTMARTAVSTAFFVPTMSKDLVDLPAAERERHDVSAFRVLISSGSSLPTPTKEALIDAFPGVRLNEGYGWTEIVWVTNLRPRDQLSKIKCVGRPILGARVEVLDPDGQPVAPGEPGEIYARMAIDFPGYFRDPERTALVRRGDLVTGGDIGTFDDEGYLYILDRKNDLIICGGENIYPLEVEDVIAAHPDVKEAGVVGVHDDRLGEVPAAYIALQPGATLDESGVLAHCEGRLAKFKWPRHVEFVEALPRNAIGKVLRRSLRDGTQANV